MNPKVKLLVLILAVLISLSLAGGEFYLFQRERGKNIELSTKVEELSAKQKETEAKFKEAQKTLSGLEVKFKEATAQIDTLNNQLQAEKASKEETIAKLAQMKSELDQQKELRSGLEKKLTKAEEDVKSIKSKLIDIDSEKIKLESKVKELETKSNVELGKIVVTPEANSVKPAQNVKIQETISTESNVAPVESKIIQQSNEGKVLVLNKEYNFVVINLGNKDGVTVGDQFSVFRADKYLGDIQIEKVQDVMSAAGFLSEALKNKVKEGDKVVKKIK